MRSVPGGMKHTERSHTVSRPSHRARSRRTVLAVASVVLALVALLGTPAPAGASSPQRDVVQVVAGVSHSCALIDDGTVRCWGSNGHGQLGDGTGVDSSLAV